MIAKNSQAETENEASRTARTSPDMAENVFDSDRTPIEDSADVNEETGREHSENPCDADGTSRRS